MHPEPSDISRVAARVILVDDQKRVLYLHGKESGSGRQFWVMPGGGLATDESFEDAAVREVLEETGIRVDLGPCVWTRRHVFEMSGKPYDQYERYFIAHVPDTKIQPKNQDDYIVGHRWWSQDELKKSDEQFAPRRVSELLPSILSGEYPSEPYDCGV